MDPYLFRGIGRVPGLRLVGLVGGTLGAFVDFTPALVDLHLWLSEIVHEFYPEQVIVEISADQYPKNIVADTEYLNMLVHNLLQNAERHGKGKIIASVIATEKNIALIVEDDGAGIAVAEREHVLKPFYRVVSAKNTQGHGMGLAIVDRIAQWHKAEVKLETSEKLGGLKISVIFAHANIF